MVRRRPRPHLRRATRRRGAPEATFVADLADADHIPSDAFDCIILTQTLHLIYDAAAIATFRRILKPRACCWLPSPASPRSARTSGPTHGTELHRTFRRTPSRSIA
ncbi:MAG: methyltransferase domain-containing protein [Chloroflexia bacterium]